MAQQEKKNFQSLSEYKRARAPHQGKPKPKTKKSQMKRIEIQLNFKLSRQTPPAASRSGEQKRVGRGVGGLLILAFNHASDKHLSSSLSKSFFYTF